jgi:DnaJ-class molecular chaperone
VADEERSGDEACMACRGTGQVISTLGGEERRVDCPWCEGTGKRIPDHDAQTRWREREDGGEEPPPPAA